MGEQLSCRLGSTAVVPAARSTRTKKSSSTTGTTRLEFQDGSTRTTFATHSLGMDRGPLRLECLENDKAVQSLRKTTAKVALTLARVLDWNMKPRTTLLRSSSAHGRNNFTLTDIVQEVGEHLEHFHVYETAVKNEATKSANTNTIQWHTDQGLALLFTPGQQRGIVGDNALYIQLGNGQKKRVQFTQHDQLVLLLGDGVNQYVNHNSNSNDDFPPLRALPHALKLSASTTKSDSPRVWYGLMILPPPQAIHPLHQMTFAKLRETVLTGDHLQYLAGSPCMQSRIHQACPQLFERRELLT